jgi:DNA repair protein RadC
VAERLGAEAARLDREVFWVLPLNAKYRLIRPPVEITSGLVDTSLAHPREVFREAVRATAAAIVLAHNHPSGDPKPSREDVRMTRRLVEAGRIVGIPVLDHVIVGRGALPAPYASLRDSGAVQFDG